MEQFWQIFWGAVGTVLTALASWGSVMLTTWLSTKIKDKRLQRLALALNDIITRAVVTVNQTLVDGMKKAGAFNDDAHKEVFGKCKDYVMNQLTQELKDYVKDNFGDVEAYVTTCIESKIVELKGNKKGE